MRIYCVACADIAWQKYEFTEKIQRGMMLSNKKRYSCEGCGTEIVIEDE